MNLVVDPTNSPVPEGNHYYLDDFGHGRRVYFDSIVDDGGFLSTRSIHQLNQTGGVVIGRFDDVRGTVPDILVLITHGEGVGSVWECVCSSDPDVAEEIKLARNLPQFLSRVMQQQPA